MPSFVSSVRRLPRQLRVLSQSLYHLFKDYPNLGHNSRKLWRAWRDGGTRRLKHALLDLTFPPRPQPMPGSATNSTSIPKCCPCCARKSPP